MSNNQGKIFKWVKNQRSNVSNENAAEVAANTSNILKAQFYILARSVRGVNHASALNIMKKTNVPQIKNLGFSFKNFPANTQGQMVTKYINARKQPGGNHEKGMNAVFRSFFG